MNVIIKKTMVLRKPTAEHDLTPQSWQQPAIIAGAMDKVSTTIIRMMPMTMKKRLAKSMTMSKMLREIAYQSRKSSLPEPEGGAG